MNISNLVRPDPIPVECIPAAAPMRPELPVGMDEALGCFVEQCHSSPAISVYRARGIASVLVRHRENPVGWEAYECAMRQAVEACVQTQARALIIDLSGVRPGCDCSMCAHVPAEVAGLKVVFVKPNARLRSQGATSYASVAEVTVKNFLFTGAAMRADLKEVLIPESAEDAELQAANYAGVLLEQREARTLIVRFSGDETPSATAQLLGAAKHYARDGHSVRLVLDLRALSNLAVSEISVYREIAQTFNGIARLTLFGRFGGALSQMRGEGIYEMEIC